MFRMHSAGDPKKFTVGAKNETRTEQCEIHCFESVKSPHRQKCLNCICALCPRSIVRYESIRARSSFISRQEMLIPKTAKRIFELSFDFFDKIIANENICTNSMEIKISDFVQKRYDLNKLILLNIKLSCKS